MPQYEGVFVLSSRLGDEKTEKTIQEIQDTITKAKGKVGKLEKRGRKSLAYQIRKEKEGYYVLLDFELEPTAIPGLERSYHLNDGLLRHMICRK